MADPAYVKVGFSTKVLITAFLPVVLLLAGTFIALRIFVDGSIRDGALATASAAQMASVVRRGIEEVFTVAALVSFVVVFLVSVFSARSIGRPLTAIVDRLRESKLRGELLPIHVTSRAVEVKALVDALNEAAAAIQENKDKLARAHVQFIAAMASALDARDVYTAGHSRRVAEFACATAREMGVGEELVDVIRVGSLLHDVGKIGIPDSILLKPDRLTREEIFAVRLHPSIGRQIVERIEGFEPYLPIIELHHENHDGSGYPHGLKGSQIPLEVRIVHTVDAFDAMTSDRPYCRGMSHAEAMTRIRSSVGAMFDPEVVAAFQRVRAATALDSNEPSVRDYVQLARSLAGANLELHAAETSDGQDQLS